MKTSFKFLLSALLVAAMFFGYGSKALAASPYLSLSNTGGDNVSVSVSNTDPYSAVQLLYTAPGSSLATEIGNFGTTSGSGNFSTVISSSAYGLSGGAQVQVKVNNQISNIISWNTGSSGCGYYGCSVGGLTFGQTNASLTAGQSVYISISSGVNMSAYPPYISSNSNSSVASASISNNQLYITGNNSGSTTITVCLSGGSTCGSVYVTVSGNSGGQISFSENNLALYSGQTKQVSVYGGYNYGSYSYYVSNNSNSNVVSASINSYGNTLNLEAKSSGSANITVCQNNYNGYCGILNVTVSGSNTSGQLSFSQNNPSLNVGQNQTINVYNNLGITGYSYFISSNSNPNAVAANISGGTINLQGQNSGNSSITVCMNGYNYCGTLYVTVSGGYSTVSLSQTNLTLSQGQSIAVAITGGYSYYVSANTNTGAVTASLSGNTLNLYGNNAGYATITVCQNNTTACANVGVTVTAGYGNGNLSLINMNLTQPTVGQYYSYQLSVTGGTSPYYFSIQSGQLPAGLSLSSSGLISGIPQNNTAGSFVVRIYDNYSHSVNIGFTLTTGGVLGSSVYGNGTLINEGGTVFVIYKNAKTGFASAATFLGLGYRFSDVVNAGTTNIPFSGYTVVTANASHPWGSWVKSGQTVYFVHELGLIPVSDYATFINNGGSDNLVVAANSYDFARPILSVMVANDTRLK